MEQEDFFNKIFRVSSNGFFINPERLFESTYVYLIINKTFKIIWIWIGNKAPLFHKYKAVKKAMRLISEIKYQGFTYDIIREGHESKEFRIIMSSLKWNGTKNNKFNDLHT
ncbi:MAG: hypothetical protein GF383_03180 [Candidatus Lokiarchaeota archaeon]|nr:hypothetical protein [Candidatus Lokiarchaeota archaeon]MBD3338606.1 hypothetical protein [Candidatus Lokiarchaeota archaeon]